METPGWGSGTRTQASTVETAGGKLREQRAAPWFVHKETETRTGELPCPGTWPASGGAHLGSSALIPEALVSILSTTALHIQAEAALRGKPLGDVEGAWSVRTRQKIRAQCKLRGEREVKFMIQVKRLPTLSGRRLGPLQT